MTAMLLEGLTLFASESDAKLGVSGQQSRPGLGSQEHQRDIVNSLLRFMSVTK